MKKTAFVNRCLRHLEFFEKNSASRARIINALRHDEYDTMTLEITLKDMLAEGWKNGWSIGDAVRYIQLYLMTSQPKEYNTTMRKILDEQTTLVAKYKR